MYIVKEAGGRAASQACSDYQQFGSQRGDMAEESEKIELGAKQKTELLKFGLKAAAEDREDEEYKADLLYDILNHPLQVDGPAINMLPAPLRGLSRKIRPIAGAPLIELLTRSDTSISTIEAIKEYAKESGTTGNSEDKNDVFLAVYYAAIASALLFHNKRITQHSYKDLEQFFSLFTEKDWILEEIKGLFRKARIHCERIAGRPEGPKE